MSEYKVHILEEKELAGWDDFVNQSSNGTIFHKLGWLRIVENHSKSHFIPVAVRKGNDIVCLCPLFYKRKFGFRIVLSPPNSCGIPYLGPVFRVPGSGKYNRETTYIAIIDSLSRFAEEHCGFDFLRIVHTPGIYDMRPYMWKDYSILPNYTYTFDLTRATEDLYKSFHTSTRNAIKNASDNNNIVISKDPEHIFNILSLVKKRYSEQNREFKISENYLRELTGSSLSNNFESIAIFKQQQMVVGDITLTNGYHAYTWLGTVRRVDTIPGAGELLLWEKIKEFKQRGLRVLDFVGANTRHICKHKAKYGANLENYFVAQNSTLKGKIALRFMNIMQGESKNFD